MIRMPAVGDQFGRYRLVRELGHGGMGVVYLARDTELDRDVALKIIVPQLAGDADYRARFKREATALTRMDSPHIVAVHDHGELDGCLYLVTQLVPHGDLLQQIAAGGPLAPSTAIDVVLQVLDGLADAHAAGIVHRDVKPSNVLLRRRDHRFEAFLCDFGVATVPGDQLTRTGALVGSFPYMAPERHQGEPAGVAGDLYSVGCVLWQVLTGTAPYAGTDVEVALAHLQAPIPQLPAGEPFSDAVNAVLRTAMAKRPGERYRSAKAMRRDLAGPSTSRPTGWCCPPAPRSGTACWPAWSTPAPRRRPGVVAVPLWSPSVASALVVALVAALAGVLSPDDAPAEVAGPVVTTTVPPGGPTTAPSGTAPGTVRRRPVGEFAASARPGGHARRRVPRTPAGHGAAWRVTGVPDAVLRRPGGRTRSRPRSPSGRPSQEPGPIRARSPSRARRPSPTTTAAGTARPPPARGSAASRPAPPGCAGCSRRPTGARARAPGRVGSSCSAASGARRTGAPSCPTPSGAASARGSTGSPTSSVSVAVPGAAAGATPGRRRPGRTAPPGRTSTTGCRCR